MNMIAAGTTPQKRVSARANAVSSSSPDLEIMSSKPRSKRLRTLRVCSSVSASGSKIVVSLSLWAAMRRAACARRRANAAVATNQPTANSRAVATNTARNGINDSSVMMLSQSGGSVVLAACGFASTTFLSKDAFPEQILRQLQAHRLEPGQEGRLVPGRVKLAVGFAVANAELAEPENVPQHVRAPPQLHNLRDARHLARAALEPGHVDQQIDRGRHVLANDRHWQVEAGQHHH